MNALTFVLRLLHIVCAVLWVGGVAVLTLFILPAVELAGPVGGQFMQVVTRRTKLITYLPSLGGLAVLSGIGLYWRDASLSGGSFDGSAMGMTLGAGGVAGLLALIIGGAMTGRAAKELATIGAQAAKAGAPPTAEQMQRIGVLQARMKSSSRIVLVLMLIATAAMAVARYV